MKIKKKIYYPVEFPLNPKSYVVGTNPSGKTISVELGALLNQSFDLRLLGNTCIQYPVTEVTDCESGEVVQLPLQFVQVLLKHEQLLCQILSDMNTMQETCCDDCVYTEVDILVYDELEGVPNEWNVGLLSIGSDVDTFESGDSNTGSYSIAFGSNDSEIYGVSFDNVNLVSSEDLKFLKFFVKNKIQTEEYKFVISFSKNGIESEQKITVFNGLFGHDTSNPDWHEVSIPLYESLFPDTEFDKINMYLEPVVEGDTFENVRVDNVRLVREESDCTPRNLPPNVDAGLDQSFNSPQASTILSATVSDFDGAIVSYDWVQLSGGISNISNPNSIATNLTGLSEGVYIYQITVTDDGGATATDTLTITVLAEVIPDEPPVADAGTDSSINQPENNSSLDGSGSSDSDGTITTYLWEQIGGNPVVITNPNVVSTSVTGMNTVGLYSFQLTVTDNDGLQDTDIVTITVDEEQEIPVEIQIDNGDCLNLPDWSSTTFVWTSELPSNISNGIVNIEVGDILYTSSSLSTPFATGGDYVYRGLAGFTYENQFVQLQATTGQVLAYNVCPTEISHSKNVYYNENDNTQGSDTPSGSVYVIPLDLITQGYSGVNPFSHIIIDSLTSTGDLGFGDINQKIQIGNSITVSDFNSGRFGLFLRGLTNGVGNAQENNGQFTTNLEYRMVDSMGTITDSANLEITAIPSIQIEQSFDYDGNDVSQGQQTPNGSVLALLPSFMSSMYSGSGSNPSKFVLLQQPLIGDVGEQHVLMQDNTISSINFTVSGDYGFFCRGLDDGLGNAQENNGSFTDFFVYGLMDSSNNVTDIVTITLNATNVPL